MSCVACRDGAGFDLPITMAFQPIIDIRTETVFAYEALVRGQGGAGAADVLAQVSADNRYAFDQQCRTTAIDLASSLALAANGANLSINFLPNAVYEPRACIRATLAAAMRTGFPLDRIIFEFTEEEAIDADHILNILRSYRAMGFKTAIDDFGAGYAGLGLLSRFQPDIVKLDMALIRGIDTDRIKRTIIRNTLNMLRDLDIEPVCEGIETIGEHDALSDLGVFLMQGYLFAKPAVEALPDVAWIRPDHPASLRA
ncbi:MAG: EAL domain-containing protein [Alphaproteobacteria bacterium]|jgi:EAL domain-containing protein (putative c-di-GMP-specific phosphodiesterase class I)|nr:EAL domain-containing protein [Alphaproteobacteria bacterium]MBU2043279.1 EAL domain-containing protein [Alphaproteobacteria bacterium]MBU2125032.1 EAL domain-containing protein [Alphaproteobacteria bacterium]MBU2207454.1 EAL domain-containing protein [Alphaproteobacteria bacterium]MBU2290513.1 EAL domain-containing protein [Alphaproteobacteria bacterium]